MNMRIVLYSIVFLCFVFKINSQNLVPNPSFELNYGCANVGLSNLHNWCSIKGGAGISVYLNPCHSDPLYKSPFQYYDACFQSYQPVKTGNTYINIGSYIQGPNNESLIPSVKLIDTLITGKTYCVTYYVSMWNNARYSLDKLGALFTPTPFPLQGLSCNVTTTVPIAGLYTPQVVTTPGIVFEDTLNWMEVSGSFTAVGNEAYLAIGDFFTHAQHFIKDSYPTNCNGLAEYYVDDVSVEEIEIAKAKNDTLIYAMDSVVIGNNASEAALFSWQPTAGLSCTNCPNPKASPTITTTYTVTKTQCKSVSTDEITVTVSPVGINEFGMTNVDLRILPNPANDFVTVTSRYDFEKIELLSITGQVLLTETVNSKSHQLQLQNFAEGIYFIRITYPNGLINTKKLMVQH
jgi:hypothetical protein